MVGVGGRKEDSSILGQRTNKNKVVVVGGGILTCAPHESSVR